MEVTTERKSLRSLEIRQLMQGYLTEVARECMAQTPKPKTAEVAFLWQVLAIMDELDTNGVDGDDNSARAMYELKIAYEMLIARPMKTA